MKMIGDLRVDGFGSSGVFQAAEVAEDGGMANHERELKMLASPEGISGMESGQGDYFKGYSTPNHQMRPIDLKEVPAALKLDFRDFGRSTQPYLVIVEVLCEMKTANG